MSSSVRKLSATQTEEEERLMKEWNDSSFMSKIVWRNIALFVYLHLASLYGLYLLFFLQIKVFTFLFILLLIFYSGEGITAGAHRLWAHRSYKAKLPYRIFLAVAQTLAVQNHIYEWSRDHRVHHKYSETDADPHNANRGFFFAHMGWLCMKKHPYVKTKGRGVDCSDLLEDPVVRVQRKIYVPAVLLIAFTLPAVIPWYLWGEDMAVAFFTCSMLRYCMVLHGTWAVNSAAHMFGYKPYDRHIGPVQNHTVAFWAFGEGWHNYHHVFPQDYKTSELGSYGLNWTTWFIDNFAKLGQVYDRKTVPESVILNRVQRTGDGSHSTSFGAQTHGEVEPESYHYQESLESEKEEALDSKSL